MGGILNAREDLARLMEDKLSFAKFFPTETAFSDFKEAFGYKRFDIVKDLEWEEGADMAKLQTDPVYDQQIQDYYETIFKPAILGSAVSEGATP